MQTYNGKFQQLLEHRIAATVEELKGELSQGATDYADYRFKVGQINGLRLVIAFCEDVSSDLDKQ